MHLANSQLPSGWHKNKNKRKRVGQGGSSEAQDTHRDFASRNFELLKFNFAATYTSSANSHCSRGPQLFFFFAHLFVSDVGVSPALELTLVIVADFPQRPRREFVRVRQRHLTCICNQTCTGTSRLILKSNIGASCFIQKVIQMPPASFEKVIQAPPA